MVLFLSGLAAGFLVFIVLSGEYMSEHLKVSMLILLVRSAMIRYWPLASLVFFTCLVNAIALLTKTGSVFLVASTLLFIHSAMVALLLSLAITGKVSQFMSLGYHSGVDKDNFWSWVVNSLLCSVFIIEYCYCYSLYHE